MKRKKAIIYLRVGLTDDIDSLVLTAEKWSKRRRLVVSEIIVEASSQHAKLSRLISKLNFSSDTVVVTYSICHLSKLSKFMTILAQIQATYTGIGIVHDNLLLNATARRDRSLFRISKSFVEAEKRERAQAIKQALYISKLFGRKLGKAPLPKSIRLEAEGYIRNGKSLRQVVTAMEGKISRTSVAKLRHELSKPKKEG